MIGMSCSTEGITYRAMSDTECTAYATLLGKGSVSTVNSATSGVQCSTDGVNANSIEYNSHSTPDGSSGKNTICLGNFKNFK